MNWRDQALCRDNPSLFFEDEPGYNEQEAKETCRGCPVRGDCEAWVFTHENITADRTERTGIWAGHTPQERARIARKISRQTQAPVKRKPKARISSNPGYGDWGNAKLTPEIVVLIRQQHAAGVSMRKIAGVFHVNDRTVRRIVGGHSWVEVVA